MAEFFAKQLTGTPCSGFNCAAAAAAMGLAAGSGNRLQLTADDVRAEADVSCVPHVHSESGGLTVRDVIGVFKRNDVGIDYNNPIGKAWPKAKLAERLAGGEGAVLLGQYAKLPSQFRASDFAGGHSAWVHDHNEQDDSICWHDPLRTMPRRIPISAAIQYWQATGKTKGSAGFVTIKEEAMPGLGFRIVENIKGTAKIKGGAPHALIRIRDQKRVGATAGQEREVVARVALLEPLDDVPTDRVNGFLVGREVNLRDLNVEATFVLATDVTFRPEA
jgi:hypothetical protein